MEESNDTENEKDVNDLSLWNVISDPSQVKPKSKGTQGGTSASVHSLMTGTLDKISISTASTTKPREFVISTKSRKITKKTPANQREDINDNNEDRKIVLMDCLLNIDTS